MEVTTILRRNIIYEEADVPAFLRIKESESWFRVIFWYIIFAVFMTMCVISVYTQWNEFMNNPTDTGDLLFPFCLFYWFYFLFHLFIFFKQE